VGWGHILSSNVTIGFSSQVAAMLINHIFLFVTKFHYILIAQTLISSNTPVKS